MDDYVKVHPPTHHVSTLYDEIKSSHVDEYNRLKATLHRNDLDQMEWLSAVKQLNELCVKHGRGYLMRFPGGSSAF